MAEFSENTTVGEIVKGAVRGVMTGVGYPLAAASAGLITPEMIDKLRDNVTTLVIGVVVSGLAHLWSAASKVQKN